MNVFKNNMAGIDLVLSDVVMPKKNGRDACAGMIRIRPDLKVILMSGYTADIISQKDPLERRYEFLTKPLNPSALLQKIRQVFNGK